MQCDAQRCVMLCDEVTHQRYRSMVGGLVGGVCGGLVGGVSMFMMVVCGGLVGGVCG